MNDFDENLFETVDELIHRFSTHINSAAFIGSSSPEYSCELVGEGSDIDLIIIWKSAIKVNEFKELLNENLIHNNVDLVDAWGVVSPMQSGRYTLHLHSCSRLFFENWSLLYKKSVSKYPVIVGKPLLEYVNSSIVSYQDLIKDSLGPASLLYQLKARDYKNILWNYQIGENSFQKISPISAKPIDFFLYSTLHSARNILRYLKMYVEFSQLNELMSSWEKSNGPCPEILEDLIEIKYLRRNFNVIDRDPKEIEKSSIMFLENSLNWIDIMATNPPH